MRNDLKARMGHVCLCDHGEGNGDCHQGGYGVRCPTCAACTTSPPEAYHSNHKVYHPGCDRCEDALDEARDTLAEQRAEQDDG